jgi:DNA primase catalytic subunit
VGTINGEPLLTPELIRAYYESTSIDLSVLSQINFRHFRFRLADGTFYKVPNKIRAFSTLKNQFLKTLPLDVYYSSACWLNPHKLGSRTEGKILKNIMISCDLVFDIDVNGETIPNLEQAKKQAISLKNFLISKNFDVRYLAFSGSKGFHVVCNDPWTDEKGFEDPVKREKNALEKRKQIVKEAKTQGLFFDEKVTVDTRRIIRLPGTINSKTGLICTILKGSQIELNIEKIFKLANDNNVITPRIPHIGEDDQGLRPAKSLRDNDGRLGVRPTLKNEHYFSTFITNNIPKTQLKIPILEIGKWKSITAVCHMLVKIQSQYGIGNVFLFDDQDRYVAFSLKAVSRRRLEKILFNAGSLNLNACKKYGCTYFRVGSSIGLDGNVMQPAPKLIKILESDLHGQVSRPHFEFLVSVGIRVEAPPQMLCGPTKDKLELIHGVME